MITIEQIREEVSHYSPQGQFLYHLGLLEASDILDGRVLNTWSRWLNGSSTINIVKHFKMYSGMETYQG